MMAMSIDIYYACLPEEKPTESAALELAQRVFQQQTSRDSPTVCNVHPLDNTFELDGNNNILFLVSCGPDGSVHRNVRKLTKALKEKAAATAATATTPRTSKSYGVALLGHAVCKTSAEQMRSEVFGAGRRLVKALEQALGTPIVKSLETQVELAGPEEALDPWIRTFVTTAVCNNVKS